MHLVENLLEDYKEEYEYEKYVDKEDYGEGKCFFVVAQLMLVLNFN